ncbi:Mu-like prophage major head subunit gpT family protein [Alishewanella sp. 16-MA]|uniref:Mu-like prophage major head subunit gpT family protein n=1 Tax=Alishewanella maricola TaxID=2795740 RepID=A0ABS8C1G8_9ALTE|nr:Mu-like prophage major head subunit gpT family protein [Alishewanella maricola]MCB5226172.1 Mu-like prophage major head subunit gpT family protein [Alishewanella maricola]
MAMINSATLNALRVSFSKKFEEGKAKAKPQYSQIATVVTSSGKSNTYGWLGQFPKFREWIGDRVLKSMKEHAYTVTNKSFESTVVVDRDDIADDVIGVYAPLMEEMGYGAEVFPDELCFPLLKAGFTTPCYDGQNFFDTDHPVNAEVDGSGADTSVSNAIVDVAYTGEPWFLLDVSRALKPIIYQDRTKAQFQVMDNPDDESVFMRKQFRYGTDVRANAGYGFWQMAVGVKKTLAYQSLWDAITLMKGFKADGGRPLGLGKNKLLLVVPSSMEQLALQLKEREQISDGTTTVSNELRNKFDVLVADFL